MYNQPACVRSKRRQLYIWGRSDGVSGVGQRREHADGVPRLLAKERDIRKIACGAFHVVLLSSRGEVHTFGSNLEKALGHSPDSIEVLHPRLVDALCGKAIHEVAAGAAHTIALGSVGPFTWGCNKAGQLGLGHTRGPVAVPNRVDLPLGCRAGKRAAAGMDHTVVLDVKGGVLITGDGEHGVTGANPGCVFHSMPMPAGGGTGPTCVDVASGARHVVCVTACGRALSWGWNKWGQLGHASTGLSLDHALYMDLARDGKPPDEAVVVACGFASTLLTTFSGRTLSCGRRYVATAEEDSCDRWATEIDTPRTAGTDCVAIALEHCVIVSAAGAAVTWGPGAGGAVHGVPLPGLVCKVASALHFSVAVVEPASETKQWVDVANLQRRHAKAVAVDAPEDALSKARAALDSHAQAVEPDPVQPPSPPSPPPTPPAPPQPVVQRKRVGGGWINLSNNPFKKK